MEHIHTIPTPNPAPVDPKTIDVAKLGFGYT